MTSFNSSQVSYISVEIPTSLHDSVEAVAIERELSFIDCVKKALHCRAVFEDIRDGKEHDPYITPSRAAECLSQNILDSQLDLDSVLSEGHDPKRFLLRLRTHEMAYYEQKSQKEGFRGLEDYTVGSLLFLINEANKN
ncbi:MAG: hypothetical protein NVSMB46_01850 [Candidatus Saccharimonadales bacterium]